MATKYNNTQLSDGFFQEKDSEGKKYIFFMDHPEEFNIDKPGVDDSVVCEITVLNDQITSVKHIIVDADNCGDTESDVTDTLTEEDIEGLKTLIKEIEPDISYGFWLDNILDDRLHKLDSDEKYAMYLEWRNKQLSA